MTVRVRFAPSPTGYLHLGGLRTALFNYLYARKHHGKFIIRIEDTDSARIVPGSANDILECMKRLGLEYDEGPDVNAKDNLNTSFIQVSKLKQPYFQSMRADLYRKHAYELLEKGYAYRCFCSSHRLAELRLNAERTGRISKYDGHCRYLTQEQIQHNLKGGSFTIRMKTPDRSGKTIQFTDKVFGAIVTSCTDIGDTIILKSDGLPSYHLANVVDDHYMNISHVLRGEVRFNSPIYLGMDSIYAKAFDFVRLLSLAKSCLCSFAFTFKQG
jgi:glutamyl-tRNA synthetase